MSNMISQKENLIKKLSKQMLESQLTNLGLKGDHEYKLVVWGCVSREKRLLVIIVT